MSRSTQEQISVWRPNDVPGVELRSGVSVKEPYPRHWHEEYQFCLIQAGGGELVYRGTCHDTPQISLFIVHPGEVHSNHTETGCSFRSMYVDPEFIRSAVSEVAGRSRSRSRSRSQSLPFFPDPMVLDREITSSYEALHLSFENGGTTLEQETLVLHLINQLLERHAEDRLRLASPRQEPRAVQKVREYILEFHAHNISLTELARLANVSPFHLTRVFAKEVGMPPHAFQTQVRVARAKKLIRTGVPLADVAAMTGFADQSHFIRHFKRLMKITPGEYLKNSNNVLYPNSVN